MPGARPETIGAVPGGSPSLYGLVPRGAIVLWSGLLRDIPAGWALCDGRFGTPNLLARFVRGVGTATTNPGTTGGSDSVTVTQNAHQHEIPFAFSSNVHRNASFGTGGSVASTGDWGVSGDTSSRARQKTQSVTATNQSHDNRPAFFELAYIMKL
ncbi:MAG: tail fiber protein [Planctomycetia bacterium]|nr:tail fiber protein [Planctomycetia bacterium]